MKRILFALLLPVLSLPAQDQPAEPAAAEVKRKIPQYQIDLDNLSPKDKQTYWSTLIRAEQVFQQKRIFECLDQIAKAHQIYDRNPASLNLQGACFVEFRNFDKAAASFKKALKEDPDNGNVLFNQAEIAFVTHNWQSAHDQLQRILPRFENGNQGMSDLIRFKILLCKLKLGDKPGAEAILEGTTFLDDTPLYYYGIAAIAYSEDRVIDAEIWLARAARIFSPASSIAPWQDTLIEFGYIKSFYGGDLEVGDSASGE